MQGWYRPGRYFEHLLLSSLSQKTTRRGPHPDFFFTFDFEKVLIFLGIQKASLKQAQLFCKNNPEVPSRASRCHQHYHRRLDFSLYLKNLFLTHICLISGKW